MQLADLFIHQEYPALRLASELHHVQCFIQGVVQDVGHVERLADSGSNGIAHYQFTVAPLEEELRSGQRRPLLELWLASLLLLMIACAHGTASSASSASSAASGPPAPFESLAPAGGRDEGKIEAAQRAGAFRWSPQSGSDADTSGFDALHVDLADLTGYHYQNGAIFSVYVAGETSAIGNGGRYDGIGRAFGRARPATGFTFDLRQLAGVVARNH